MTCCVVGMTAKMGVFLSGGGGGIAAIIKGYAFGHLSISEEVYLCWRSRKIIMETLPVRPTSEHV